MSQENQENGSPILFWGCFIALITTAFGFVGRMFLIETWGHEFGLDPAEQGRLAGIGIWPFAVSIIGFSLLIDRIGYRVSMIIAFVGHITWAIMGVAAYYVGSGEGATEASKETAFSLLYWGSLILALGNGTVEAFINPVVATMFNKDKTKWLNILHAGWPGGLVIAGMITIFIDTVPWSVKVGLIAVPAVIYFVMLLGCKFPVQERVASGVSYKEMLGEFGILGAAVVGFLVALQLMDFFSGGDTSTLTGAQKGGFIAVGAAIVIGFGVYTKSLGRPLLFFLVLIMMPLATTEIGTDGWIEGIMKGALKDPETGEQAFHGGWVLVYTSVIMMVLRFYCGPIIAALTPLGLLLLSSVFAIIGLYLLSFAASLAFIFLAATVYALGKTFFWPTMLGVVSEQTPRGGAMTLNAISGIGMLAVGTLGFPYIGVLQSDKQIEAVVASAELKTQAPAIFNADGSLKVWVKEDKEAGVAEVAGVLESKASYEIINYDAINAGQVAALTGGKESPGAKAVGDIMGGASQGALGNMTIFPMIMLGGYILLFLYFKSKGGYKPVELEGGGSAGGAH